jgi:transcriptional regulator with XRE-family HTH domain
VATKLNTRTRRTVVEIGKRIRAAREAADISQEMFAARIGMTRTNYARIEHGRTNVTIDSLVRIASGLGLDLTVRFEEHEKKAAGRS